MTQLRGKIELVPGIFGAVFAIMLYMIQSPSSPLQETLIIVAAVSLTATIYFGTGARRSRRHFAGMVISAVLALICMATLTAQPRQRAPQPWLQQYVGDLRYLTGANPPPCMTPKGAGAVPPKTTLVIIDQPIDSSGNHTNVAVRALLLPPKSAQALLGAILGQKTSSLPQSVSAVRSLVIGKTASCPK